MIFQITRASSYSIINDLEGLPKEARMAKVKIADQRTCFLKDAPDHVIDKWHNGDFYGHTENKIGMVRYKDAMRPVIEINTLEELMNLAKEWGELVVNEDSIVIYDDYIE